MDKRKGNPMTILMLSGIILTFLSMYLLTRLGAEEMRGMLTFIFSTTIIIVISRIMKIGSIKREAMIVHKHHNNHKERISKSEVFYN